MAKKRDYLHNNLNSDIYTNLCFFPSIIKIYREIFFITDKGPFSLYTHIFNSVQSIFLFRLNLKKSFFLCKYLFSKLLSKDKNVRAVANIFGGRAFKKLGTDVSNKHLKVKIQLNFFCTPAPPLKLLIHP